MEDMTAMPDMGATAAAGSTITAGTVIGAIVVALAIAGSLVVLYLIYDKSRGKHGGAHPAQFIVNLILVPALAGVAIFGFYQNSQTAQSMETMQMSMQQSADTIAQLTTKVAQLEEAANPSRSYSWEDGTYTAGVEFDAGTYNLTAASGAGTVTVAVEGQEDVVYNLSAEAEAGPEREISGVILPEGAAVTVAGVHVQMNTTPREGAPVADNSGMAGGSYSGSRGGRVMGGGGMAVMIG